MELVYQYRPANSFLHRLDPVTKTVGLFAVSFLAFGTFDSSFQIAILLCALIIAIWGGRMSPREIWRGTGLMAIASGCFFIVQSILLHVPGQIELVHLGPKIIYLETVDYALAVSLRIYTIFFVSFIFIRTTHPRDLAVSFVQNLRLPYKIPYAFFIALRIIPMIEDEAKTVRAAHSVRGVGEKTGLKGRIENTKRFTVPLLIRSLRDASVTVQSMEARGFGAYPTRTFVDEMKMTRLGKIITGLLILAVIIWYALVFAGLIQLKYSIQ